MILQYKPATLVGFSSAAGFLRSRKADVVKVALRSSDDGVLIALRVSPGAKKSGVEGMYGENSIKLKVASPPVDGKANKEVESLLANFLGVRKSDVEVVRGASSRDKAILVRGVESSAVERILAKYL